MARIASYRDLDVWRKAMALVEMCYRATGSFPKAEQFGLAAQLRRTAISIPSNIAEGHNRRSRQAYRNHIAIALGSQAELETQVELAYRLGFLSSSEVAVVRSQAAETGRMLHGLVRALEKSDGTMMPR